MGAAWMACAVACSSERSIDLVPEVETTPAGLPVVHLEALPRPHEIELTLRTKDHELTVFERRARRRFMVSGQTRSLDEARFAAAFPELHAVYRAATAEEATALRPRWPAVHSGCIGTPTVAAG